MNDLIDNIVAFLKAAMIDSLSAKSVHKGFGAEDPDQIAMHDYPIVEVDDGGERVDSEIAANTQERIYKVAIFMAVIESDQTNSLTSILNLSNEVKALIELEANRQKDGHVWGISIESVNYPLNDNGAYKFYRGRSVIVEYRELEDTYGEF